MEEQEKQSPISDELNEVLRTTIDFAYRKFTAGEYFSIMMITRHISLDNKLSVTYHRLETLEESLDVAEKFMREKADDITMYALVYLADREANESAIVGWIEEVGADSAWLIADRYKIEEQDGQTILKKSRGIELIRKAGFKWLPR